MRVQLGAAGRSRWRHSLAVGAGLLLGAAQQPVRAADVSNPTVPPSSIQDQPSVAAPPSSIENQPSVPAPRIDVDGVAAYFTAAAARARATQPSWSSPLVTTTGLLEQRVRFDIDYQHSGNGTNTTLLDNGKGLDLIVSDTNEIQITVPPYYIRTGVAASSPKGKPILPIAGFGDWPFLRVEQRLASSPESDGNYVLTAWLQVQAPSGIEALTSNAWTYLPTLAFGKGWGPFDIQGTIGGVIPASHTNTLGHQIQTNIAFQYHVLDVLWPEIEVNWTYYTDGQRGGLNQVYLTPGLVIGRFSLSTERYLKFTFGLGYQVAVAPDFRAKPLTPAYNHAFLFTSRLNF